MDTMKAVVYNKNDAPDKLLYQDVEKPVPGDNEILVKIMAVSPNAADYRSMKMGIIPKKKIFGSGVAGRVEAAGKNIRQFSPGDEVIGDLTGVGFGGFAEYTVAPEKAFVRKPEKITFEEAATLGVAATTALNALRDKGKIQKGQSVLILGSGGGVGTFALQLAKYFGAEVTAVSSTRNLEQSTSLGADFVMDYTGEDLTKSKKQYDLIIAINGSYPLLACKRILKKKGVYVAVGGALSQIFKPMLFGWFLSLGTKKFRVLAAKPNQPDLEYVAGLLEEGKIKAVIENRYTLSKTAEAMQYVGKGHAKGKLVIVAK